MCESQVQLLTLVSNKQIRHVKLCFLRFRTETYHDIGYKSIPCFIPLIHKGLRAVDFRTKVLTVQVVGHCTSGKFR